MNMKRLLALGLAAVCALSLVSCGDKKDPPPAASSSADVSALAPVEPEPEPEPEFPFPNPLTGEGCDVDVGANRPVAVMLNDHKAAMPQLGVSSADIIYETLAEGGITRMLAVFQDLEGVEGIGTVRSARDYYVSLAYGHDAVFLHAGGSPQGYIKIKELGVTAMDCVNGPYEGTLFWRDSTRRHTAGLEHSVVTDGSTVTSLLPTYKHVSLTHKEGYEQPLVFMEAGETAQGQPAASVSVKFSGYKTGVFTYDPETGLYQVEQFDAPYVDGNTNQQVAVKNVLVLQTEIGAIKGDDKGRRTVRTTGTGSGQFFCDGTVQDITWTRNSEGEAMRYTDAAGQPLKLGVGHTYVNLVDSGTPVTVH